MQTTMRIPCSRCGQLNNVERAAEVSFRCTACDAVNTMRTLAGSADAASPVQEPRRAPARWRTAGPANRTTGVRPAAVAAPSRGSLGRVKQALVALMVIATATALVHGPGTFATFNATTTNAANITTGVLLLGDKVANGAVTTECFSAGTSGTVSSGNSNSCTGVWNVAAPNKPGDTFIAHLALRNPGNISASVLQLYATVATCDSAPGYLDATSGTTFKGSNQTGLTTTLTALAGIGATSLVVASSANFSVGETIQVDTTTATLENVTISAIPDGTHLTVSATTKSHAIGATVAGAGLCRQAQLVVAKTDNTYEASNTGTCLYGNAAAGAPMTGSLQCAYTASKNLRDFNDNYVTAGVPGPITIAGGIAAGATQNYIVAITFPNGSDNQYQGLAAAVTFNWFAQQ